MRRRGLIAVHRRAHVLALVFLASLWLGTFALPADAQVTTIETVPPDVDDEGRTAGERIDQAVVMLRVLGVVVVVSTAAYWWRTRPNVNGVRNQNRDELQVAAEDEIRIENEEVAR
ncbi:MAG: hypothetical protein QF777_07265 [Acidimicrobiales bacterium]|jgi:hypothetical protein|nr:hypothetical protein [Actinomycetes bacterium]MDG1988660.1 hypothetical protein [Acidimicrobiales bacterium]MDP6287468.1 hypothetical protein [Acidimicrobiales bacterium]MDP6911350.1 hypothetical protein [Acidimicrobiales bacterium]HJM73332.1 hypothetical protein [Acidimicrobiales bacterium]|tara:strand:- start:7158 stop:7505 length:348 start_codon:yes stop_codon:yes gene_type:complete